MMNLTLNILKEATDNKWPYPKTFELLKKADLQSYQVQFENIYQGLFTTNSGKTFSQDTLKGYEPLKSSKVFSKDGIKTAIMRHIQEKTDYVELLSDIA